MLIEYYFKIKYIKGTGNIKADALSRILGLQGEEKPLRAILKIDNNKKIRYNYLQLTVIYKTLISNQEQRI